MVYIRRRKIKMGKSNSSRGPTWGRDGKKVDGLTQKMRVFVREVMVDWDQKRAATVAGYKNPAVKGSQLMNNKAIQKAIAKAQSSLDKDAVMRREEIIKELSAFARSNVVKMFDADTGVMHVTDLHALPEIVQRCIQSVKAKYWTDEQGDQHLDYVECKLVDKLGSIDLLMRHYGMFAPKELDVNVGLDWDALYSGKAPTNGAPDGLEYIEGEIAKASEPLE